jgi:DNA-directed RNA polymerase specialized sigma24 family protein
MEELVKYMRAMVVLQLQALPNDEASQKPELLLSRAGFTAREIADILGKNQAAVAKAIERAKKASRAVPSAPAGTPQSENAVL